MPCMVHPLLECEMLFYFPLQISPSLSLPPSLPLLAGGVSGKHARPAVVEIRIVYVPHVSEGFAVCSRDFFGGPQAK